MSIDLEALKHGPAETGVEELILKRWSPRTFADKPLSPADLTKIFTAAGWAASSSNEQPWRFLVGHKGDATFAKILDTLVEFNQLWAHAAALLVLSVGKKTFTKNGTANAWALHDVGAASANMALQAVALGIHTHGMAGFDKDKARANFGIPEDFEPGAVWAMGYLGELDALPENFQKMEAVPRVRKGLAEYVFAEWEKPAL